MIYLGHSELLYNLITTAAQQLLGGIVQKPAIYHKIIEWLGLEGTL